MDGRYLTPMQLQIATVDILFGTARTLNTCSQALLSVQSAVWRHWWGHFTGASRTGSAAR